MADSDATMSLRRALGSLAEVFDPKDATEPILAPRVREAVYEWLTEVNSAADLAKLGVKARSSCLAVGPPGTGKTTLAHHLAARLGLPMAIAGAENLVSSYLGESGKNIDRLFSGIRSFGKPCVLFIDEIDAIAGKRENEVGSASSERRSTLSVLLRKMESFDGILVAATNLEKTIDPAVWRRFAMHISVDLPEWEERYAILAMYLFPLEWTEDAIGQLASYTAGAPPSVLKQLCEGIKRALIIRPRLRRPVDTFEAVVRPIVESLRLHPSYEKPFLWKETDSCMLGMSEHEWPPKANPRGAP